MQWYGYLLIVLAVLVLGGLALVAPRLRRRPLPPAPPAPERIPEAAPQVPVTPVEEAVPVAEAPAVERPEPTAGRLVRLRARLARSQNALGRGLLAVLARDRLDEDAWDEVEETLISADVGVEPTREIVERLRERTRVLGTRSAAELRTLLTEELVGALD